MKWKTKKEPKEVKSKDGVIRRNLYNAVPKEYEMIDRGTDKSGYFNM